ncbi:MAG: ubiquinone/menaquinone biosynthesis methyltransferase [Acidobacteriaceae bacterium]
MDKSAAVNPGARPRGETSEDAAAEHVRDLFDSIAPRYDLLNHLLSMGLDRRWWRRAAQSFRGVLKRPEALVLDLCCGTGDLTAALLRLRPEGAAPITGLDFSTAMLDRARSKYSGANVQWIQGDAMHLPYPDGSFDLVTSAFGFRNLTNYAEGLAEIYRVLTPGGQIGILEANQPDGLRGWGYGIYFQHLLPVLGGLISGQPAAYRYLPDSVMQFPRPDQMLRMMRDAGFQQSAWDAYLLRAAGLYRGVKH